MRTKVQGVKRYFTSIWSLYVLVTGALMTGVFVVDEPTPDWTVAALTVMSSSMAAIIGFIHGITTFVAREHDERDAASAALPCVNEYCRDEKCPYQHD